MHQIITWLLLHLKKGKIKFVVELENKIKIVITNMGQNIMKNNFVFTFIQTMKT